jgi:ferritin-like protein
MTEEITLIIYLLIIIVCCIIVLCSTNKEQDSTNASINKEQNFYEQYHNLIITPKIIRDYCKQHDYDLDEFLEVLLESEQIQVTDITDRYFIGTLNDYQTYCVKRRELKEQRKNKIKQLENLDGTKN